MNYRTMTDQEINKRVAFHLGYTVQGTGWIDNADGIYDYISKPNDDYRHYLPDYCNSWFHAGPIMEEYGIGVTKSADVWRSSRLVDGYFYDEKPLRATMIVFIMIKEKENENDDNSKPRL